jgi:hypothetical protein
MRTLAEVVFCTMALTAVARAQAPEPVARAATDSVQPTVIGRWVLDSTPTKKNRRQTYLAAIAATDTVVGKYRTTRPILKLYCHNTVKQVGLEIWVGQQISGSLPGVAVGSHVGYTELRIQRDSQPEEKAKWLYDLDKDVMGPDMKHQHETIEQLVGTPQYRVGVPLYKIGLRYMTFDLTEAAERLAWVADHCGVKVKE